MSPSRSCKKSHESETGKAGSPCNPALENSAVPHSSTCPQEIILHSQGVPLRGDPAHSDFIPWCPLVHELSRPVFERSWLKPVFQTWERGQQKLRLKIPCRGCRGTVGPREPAAFTTGARGTSGQRLPRVATAKIATGIVDPERARGARQGENRGLRSRKALGGAGNPKIPGCTGRPAHLGQEG